LMFDPGGKYGLTSTGLAGVVRLFMV